MQYPPYKLTNSPIIFTSFIVPVTKNISIIIKKYEIIIHSLKGISRFCRIEQYRIKGGIQYEYTTTFFRGINKLITKGGDDYKYSNG